MESSKDENFYMSLLTFKVEDTIFRVPKERLEESQHFQDVLSLPLGEGIVSEGDKDENPIVLEGIKAHDFRAFLSLLYPLPSVCIDKSTITEEHCVAALGLATMWSVESVQTLVKKLLLEMKLPPVRLLELARMYDFKDGTDDAVKTLAQLDGLIAHELAARIGLDFFYAVTKIREEKVAMTTTALRSNPTNNWDRKKKRGLHP